MKVLNSLNSEAINKYVMAKKIISDMYEIYKDGAYTVEFKKEDNKYQEMFDFVATILENGLYCEKSYRIIASSIIFLNNKHTEYKGNLPTQSFDEIAEKVMGGVMLVMDNCTKNYDSDMYKTNYRMIEI